VDNSIKIKIYLKSTGYYSYDPSGVLWQR